MSDAVLQENGMARPPMSDREMHVIASVEEWNKGLPASALSHKYALIGRSPVSFFQGTNHLFWADLSGDERLTRFGNSRTVTWIVGDCSTSSFTASGSDSEGPMYGLSLTDESVIADYQYDVWRLATSIVLLARENLAAAGSAGAGAASTAGGAAGGGGGSGGGGAAEESILRAVVLAFARKYLKTIMGFKQGEVKGGGGGEGGAEGANARKLSQVLLLSGGNMKGRLVRFLAIVEREYSRRRLLKKWLEEEDAEIRKLKYLILHPILSLPILSPLPTSSVSAPRCMEEGGRWAFQEHPRKLQACPKCVEEGGRWAFQEHPGKLQACPKFEEDAVVAALASYADGVNVKGLARSMHADPASCGVSRYMALTETSSGELHVLDVRMQQRPTAYHFMNPDERRAYRHRFPHETDRFLEASAALCSSHDSSSIGWMELQVRDWVEVREGNAFEGQNTEVGGGVATASPTRRTAFLEASAALCSSHDSSSIGWMELQVRDWVEVREGNAFEGQNTEVGGGVATASPTRRTAFLEASAALCSSHDSSSIRWMELQEGVHPSAAGWYSVRDVSPYEEYPAAEGVHPSAAGRYSVRDVSPYEEEYPAAVSADVKSKLKGFALTTQADLRSALSIHGPPPLCPTKLQEGLVELAEDWARILASQHAVAASLLDPDPPVDQRPALCQELALLSKAAAKNEFEELVWEVALSYSRQVEYDWRCFQKHLSPQL
ncbi:unnamed protein product [Closterium sp. NIES-64]|nr:unnamed protein product [Closterium sp. NIES-64]